MWGRKKQVLVLGLGRFGTSVACSVQRLGHEVLAVDSDERHINMIVPHVTQAVQADATDEDVLARLDAGSFDAAVVSIGTSTRDSVLVTVLAKEAGIPLVIAKAVDELHAKVLRKVGADRVVFPERDMGKRLAHSLFSPDIMELVELDSGYRIAQIPAPGSWCGQTLQDVNVRRAYGVSVMGVRRNGEFLAAPGADMLLHAGDVLLVLGRDADVSAMAQMR